MVRRRMMLVTKVNDGTVKSFMKTEEATMKPQRALSNTLG